MEKERIRWKDLKKWAKTISDDAYIFVESYDNEHHKEFILAEKIVELSKNQILSQSSLAMMAQSNSKNQNVLALLK